MLSMVVTYTSYWVVSPYEFHQYIINPTTSGCLKNIILKPINVWDIQRLNLRQPANS